MKTPEGLEVFGKIHAFTAKWEGGFSDHSSDPGGTTNRGISLRFLRQQGLDTGDLDGDGDIDADDIRPATAKMLMKGNFWDLLNLDRLCRIGKPRLAAAIYDCAVNMGPAPAKRLAQQAVGTAVDGIWGPKTWAAFEAAPDLASAIRFCTLRWGRYCALIARNPQLADFRKGWKNRVEGLMRFLGPEWPF